MSEKPRLCDSTILHRCDGDVEGCFCMYDPACTGRWEGRRLVAVPRWISMVLAPRKVYAMMDARRRLKNAGLWR